MLEALVGQVDAVRSGEDLVEEVVVLVGHQIGVLGGQLDSLVDVSGVL